MGQTCRLHKLTSEQFEAGRHEPEIGRSPGAAIVTIEPWLAKALRQVENNNRPLKPRMVERIKAALHGGYWYVNGEVIILNTEMAVLDGKNRLQSCVEAKVAFETVITWGWPQDAFAYIDIGIKRSGGDTLSAAGETNAFALSAAAHYDWRLMTRNMATGLELPDPLIKAYVHKNAGLKASLSWGDTTAKFIPKGLGAALHYRLSQQDAARAKQFFQEIGHGENINRHDTTYWLREVLAGLRKRQQQPLHLSHKDQAHFAAIVIKGWHAFCAGRLATRDRLIWHERREEPFPELVHEKK